VEDLVQETLIAVHARRFTYDRTRRFTPWLHAIARYKLIDFLRDRRNARSVPLDEAEDLFALDDAQAGLDRMDVDRLLGTIPPKTGELIRAVKIEGRSVAEASAQAGMSEVATKVAIHRGLKLLSKRLNKGKALGDGHA
jgi:RNA polymerase sigma-70 factor (ECF subfamily)